jgi:hypothetical protein
LQDQPAMIDDPHSAGNKVASIVLAQHGRRNADAARAQRDFSTEERHRAVTEAEISRRIAAGERQSREFTEGIALAEARRADQAETTLRRERVRGRRMTRIWVLVTIGVLVAITLGTLGLWGLCLGTVISSGVLWRIGRDWSLDASKPWGHLLFALLPEVFGVIDFFR